MTQEKELNDWSDAETFKELCKLMKKCIDKEIDIFIGFDDEIEDENEHSHIDIDSVKYLLDNNFLVTTSQPGLNIIDKNVIVHENMFDINENPCFDQWFEKIAKDNNPNNDIIYGQRFYIRGIMKTSDIQNKLYQFNDYITIVHPFNCKDENLTCSYNYNVKIDKPYLLIPDNEYMHDMFDYDNEIKLYLLDLSAHANNKVMEKKKLIHFDVENKRVYWLFERILDLDDGFKDDLKDELYNEYSCVTFISQEYDNKKSYDNFINIFSCDPNDVSKRNIYKYNSA